MIKSALKTVLPEKALKYWQRRRIEAQRKSFASLTVQEAFSRIYRENLWGGAKGEYYSGSGSSGYVADKYCDYVKRFIAENRIASIVDLGCGDFQIGRRLSPLTRTYLGVDIVPEVVARNRQLFGSESVEFKCLDIISDPLPTADLCLLRQVMQHLSNTQIQTILRKLTVFHYVLITEHQLPKETFQPNKDKPHGPDTRLVDASSVVLDAPPFLLDGVTEVLVTSPDYALVSTGESITTFLWCPRPESRG